MFGVASINGLNVRPASERLLAKEIPLFRVDLCQVLLVASVLEKFVGGGSSAVASCLLNLVPCPSDARRSSGDGTVGRSRSW